MTEPTAEQVESERERAHAVLRAIFNTEDGQWQCALKDRAHDEDCDTVATALARVRKEGHAAGRDEESRFALLLAQDEIRVAMASRKKGMTQKELYYWDGRQETAQRLEKMLVDGRALRGRT